MKAAVLLLALVAVVVVGAVDQRTAFSQWMTQHGKVYASNSQMEKAFAAFQINVAIIARQNAKARAEGFDTTFALNKFSDLTPAEFKAKYLSGYVPQSYKGVSGAVPVLVDASNFDDIPDTFSWVEQHKTTAVKDQQQCGSCWAFSATEQIESMVYLKHKPAAIQHLSMQQIVDCDTKDAGCNGGDTVTAYEYVIKCGGLENTTEYGPYTAKDGKCKFDEKKVVAKISAWNYVTTPKQKNETQMLYYVAQSGPVSICVDASSWQYYTSGVIQKGCSNSLDHCVQITGYGTDSKLNVPFWYIRNSWGTDWGMSGYLMVERGKDLCGVADEVTTVTAV